MQLLSVRSIPQGRKMVRIVTVAVMKKVVRMGNNNNNQHEILSNISTDGTYAGD